VLLELGIGASAVAERRLSSQRIEAGKGRGSRTIRRAIRAQPRIWAACGAFLAPGARRRHPADRPRHEDKREVERLLPGSWRRVGVGGQFFAGSDIIDQRGIDVKSSKNSARRARLERRRAPIPRSNMHAMHRSDQPSCPRSDRQKERLTARSWGGVQVRAKLS
jgi:hypothetical protein